jgi:glucose/arabinose dehydrogenase
MNPVTKEVWTSVNERDGLGADLPPDYFTSVRDGAFYGWPYAYIGKHPDPVNGTKRKDLVAKAVIPDVLFQAHSAALGATFYTGTQFPAQYRGDAFVAMHGSWNRAEATGCKVVRIDFENGKPVGGYDDFATGWLFDARRARAFGRPAGVTMAPDGSLLIADDAGGRIWRVSWVGK